jgi:molecular chaperone DnaK
VTNPEKTVFAIKRLMGRGFARRPEIAKWKGSCPYRLVKHSNGETYVEIAGIDYSPAEISAMILQKLKADAEAYLGEKVTEAVITVPVRTSTTPSASHQGRGPQSRPGREAHHHEPRRRRWPTASTRRPTRRSPCSTWAAAPSTFPILEVGDNVVEVRATNGDTFPGRRMNFDHSVIDYLRGRVQAR